MIGLDIMLIGFVTGVVVGMLIINALCGGCNG